MKRKFKLHGVTTFIFAFMVLVLIARVCVETTTFNSTVETEVAIIEPEQVEAVDPTTDIYTLKLENIDETNNTLLFYTNHQEVFVYIENELIYSLTEDDSIFGRTPGAKWNILSLPVGVDTVEVEIKQTYANLSKQELEFQLGNAISILHDVIVGSVIDVCIALSIMLIGMALALYWQLVFRKTNEQRDVLYLGLFAIVFGIWAFGETKLAVFMFQDRAFWSYLAFTCLQTMCLPFIYFIRYFLELEDKYFHRWISGYIVIETIVAQVLHITGVAGVKETVLFTLVSIVLAILYLFYGVVSAIKNKKGKRKIIANIVGMIAIVVTSVADIGGYFVDVSESNQLGKLGFLIYAIILGEEVARTAFIKVQEANKMSIYKEMAVKDMPTGCFNRNAYAEDTSVGSELAGVRVITFDLNDLKKCNDTKGHMAGDKYIADAAHMIQDVFTGFGKVYRIGGDEFCILAKGLTEEAIKQRQKMLKQAIEWYRKENDDEGFGISCGYATYDPEIDVDIEATRHRADLSMYENKKEIKKID